MVEECLLKEHLIFEFYENGFFGDTNLLLETYGAVTNIKYYLDIIINKFLNAENNQVMFNDEDFPMGKIKNIEVIINYIAANHRANVNAYHYHKGGKMVIDVKVESPDKNSAIAKIKSVLGHEMIHVVHHQGLIDAYGESISFDDFERFYDGALYFLKNGDALEKEFGYILYYLAKSEKNAYIGQTFIDLEEYADTIIDDKSARKAIINTDTYRRLEMLKNRINNLKTLPKTDKEYLVIAFNRFTGFNVTFDKMVKWMEERYNVFLDKYFEQASKMACFYYQENFLKKKGRIDSNINEYRLLGE